MLEQPLITSRRSAPEILHFVDTVFASEAARAGLTSRGDDIVHRAHRETAKGGIEFWPALLPDGGSGDRLLRAGGCGAEGQPGGAAGGAGRRQDRRLAEQAVPGCPAMTRPIRPGDIMILLPRREPFGGEVIRQLKLRDIPVAGADRIVLTEQIAVMDLIALGRFVLQREDDLNLAALLRSPLCGLSEEDLFTLCHDREGDLWQALVATRRGDFAAAHMLSVGRCWSGPTMPRRLNSIPMP